MNLFDRRKETMPRPELEQLQLERLQALLVRLKRNVRRCREKLGDLHVARLADLAALPLTTPEEIAESFPYGMFALPLREVIRLHSTVGPGGKPLVIGHTRNDLTQWGRLVARQLVSSGVTANDVIQVSLGGSSDAAASGYVLGAELIEASVIAEDPYHVDYQAAMLQNYRPTILITTPSNALDLIRLLAQRHTDPQSLHLRTVLLSRPATPAEREQISVGLFATVRCNFGLGEVLDPGLCMECAHGRFHVNEDAFLVESVDGELVLTTLHREAIPLLRYRTRVRAELSREKCACGRTSVTLIPGARLDGRLLINETPIFESQIADILNRTPVAGLPFRLEIGERQLTIHVQMTEALLSDTIWAIEKLCRDIQSEFFARLGLDVVLRFTQSLRVSEEATSNEE
jgi:phenylacetate-CoA ligase